MRHPWQLYVQQSPPEYRDLGPWRLAANAPMPSDETVVLMYGSQAACRSVRLYLEIKVMHPDRDTADARLYTLLRVLGRGDLVPKSEVRS